VTPPGAGAKRHAGLICDTAVRRLTAFDEGWVMANVRELHPLGHALGTEALGVDLSKPLDDETFAWIAGAFAEHPVLVFRDQNLGAGELAAFGRRFGVPRKHALVKYRHRDHEEVSWLTNIEPDGKIDWYGVKRATDWRTDSTYEPQLPLLAILHAKEVPMEKGIQDRRPISRCAPMMGRRSAWATTRGPSMPAMLFLRLTRPRSAWWNVATASVPW
jgi:Taurine catabolism dioxygenase TauD, TfdA family